jgi:hypothetical protein
MLSSARKSDFGSLNFLCAAARLLLISGRSLRVLDAQAGRDDEQFVRGVLALRLEQHPANRRVDG